MPVLYAYVDEAASLADTNQFFIVAIITSMSPKEFGRILKRARTSVLGKRKKQVSELKFSRVEARVARYIIQKLAQKDIAIYVWIIDKAGRRIADTPENYGAALSPLLAYGFTRAGWGKVIIDKKYTKARDAEKLVRALRERIGDENAGHVDFKESERVPGLMIADFMAGALYRAYNRDDKELLMLLQPKIALEEKVDWRTIQQEANAPRGSVGSAERNTG